jgi:hypothetical protein
VDAARDAARAPREPRQVGVCALDRVGLTLGLVAEILAMHTAGYKILHCDLQGYAVEGLTLDNTYRYFKERFCDNCDACSPRSSSWQYSNEWQQEENKRHAEYMMSGTSYRLDETYVKVGKEWK